MTRNIITFLTLFMVVTAALTGCKKSPVSPDAQITVYLEDAPADYRSITVEIASVQIFNSSQWIDVPLLQKSISLLNLTGGVSVKLAEGFFPPGDYSMLRINFSQEDNRIRLLVGEQEEEFTLGIAIENLTREFPIELSVGDGSQSFLMLDMDAALSIVMQAEGVYLLVPKVSLMDLSVSGAISGAIATDAGTAIAERMLVTTTSTEGVVKHSYTNPSSGNFFVRLPSGTYSLRITPQFESTYQEVFIEQLVVGEGEPILLGAVKPTLKPRVE